MYICKDAALDYKLHLEAKDLLLLGFFWRSQNNIYEETRLCELWFYRSDSSFLLNRAHTEDFIIQVYHKNRDGCLMLTCLSVVLNHSLFLFVLESNTPEEKPNLSDFSQCNKEKLNPLWNKEVSSYRLTDVCVTIRKNIHIFQYAEKSYHFFLLQAEFTC